MRNFFERLEEQHNKENKMLRKKIKRLDKKLKGMNNFFNAMGDAVLNLRKENEESATRDKRKKEVKVNLYFHCVTIL